MKYSLLKKIGYLGLAKGVDMVSGLIAYGWIIRKADSIELGKYFLYLSFFQFLTPFFNISLDINGIVVMRKSNKKYTQNSFFFSVTVQRLLLFFLLILVLFFFGIITIEKDLLRLVLLSTWPIIWVIIYPVWYYQAINKEYYALITIILYKITYVAFVFFFIKEGTPVYYIPLFNYFGIVFAAFFIFISARGFSYREIRNFNLLRFVKDHFSLILTQIMTTGYTSINRIIIGFFLSFNNLVLYDFVEKVLNVFKQPLNLIVQAVFPEMIKANEKQKKELLLRLSLVTIMFIISGYLLSPQIITLIGGDQIKTLGGDSILRLTLPLIIITTLSAAYSSFYLLTNKNNNKFYLKGVFIGIILFYILLVTFVLLEVYTLKSHIVILYIVEIFILYYFIKKSYEIINNNFRPSKSR